MLLQSLSDNELLARLRNDDEQAFRELYDRYWYKMYVLAHRKLRRREGQFEISRGAIF
ncbi:hypothetical protein [Spirosoma harenae]